MLGIVSLSDYHVMDTPLHLNKYKFGLPAIGDMSRRPTENDLKIGTSLNHTIHFHRHDGFRADDLTYIEVETSWASDGRAMLHSNIFSQTGLLIATCSQEVSVCRWLLGTILMLVGLLCSEERPTSKVKLQIVTADPVMTSTFDESASRLLVPHSSASRLPGSSNSLSIT